MRARLVALIGAYQGRIWLEANTTGHRWYRAKDLACHYAVRALSPGFRHP